MQKHFYLIQSHSGSFPAQIIKLVCRKRYSHVSIALDPKLSCFYSFGRKHPDFFLIGGLVEEQPGRGIYQKFPKTHCLVREYTVEEATFRELERSLGEYLREKERYHYSFLGVFFAIFRLPLRRKYHLFCSEFVRNLLERAGLEVGCIPKAAKPMDFDLLPGGRVIYEGLLNDLPRCEDSNCGVSSD